MRKIDLIVIHCSATRSDRAFPVTSLIACHRDRFGYTGYHYYIERDGTVYQTRHEQLIGAPAAVAEGDLPRCPYRRPQRAAWRQQGLSLLPGQRGV